MIQAIPGKTLYPGVQRRAEGYEFTLEVPPGEEASLLLYEKNKEGVTEIPFSEKSRQGNLLSLLLKGLPKGEIRYNYKISGEVVHDAYARYLCNTPAFGEKSGKEEICCGHKEESFHWTDTEFVPKKLSDSILYKVQVRSFTMHKSSKVRKKGTFQGLEQKISYLCELGVTGVLLMPVYEYCEHEKEKGKDGRYLYAEGKLLDKSARVNCWGYTGDADYFAPKRSFCASRFPMQEFRHMVNELHSAGLECLLEFYFDGNVAPSRMLDILRYWKTEYHVDGFHLMGEGICQELFMKDALLAGSKLFFHDVDGKHIFRGERPVCKTAAEYNEGFLYCMRHVLKGDEKMIDEFIFRNKRNPEGNGIINYMADQDGFTIQDMVSYEERHNEANGENNRDGIEYNCTWNCGVEGPSRKTNVRALRLRQMKNAFLLLLLSQGTPLIFQGDERGNSQKGNNNVWCQDNEIGWVNWNNGKAQEELFTFVKNIIRLRRENPILHMEEELKGIDYKALGYPDISYHGSQAWYVAKKENLRYLGMMYCKDYSGQERDFLFAAYNFHWMSHEIALPGVPEEISWRVIVQTDEEEQGGFYEERLPVKEKTIQVPPRTIIILSGKQDENACGSGNILRRLQGTSF